MLRGREREQTVLRDRLSRAAQGEGSALVLRGQPGVGKSALLDDAARTAGEHTVLRTRGVESEAPLPFAALHRLLRPTLHLLDEIPAPQALALRAALGETTEPVGERHHVFLAALNLLSEASAQHPVLLVVDDAHWLDDGSAAALLFLARRLEGERIAVLFAVRDDEQGAFGVAELPVLDLTGLEEAAADLLIADQTEGAVAARVRAELLAATSGNPLGLLELTRALTSAQLAGHDRMPARLPLTEGVERAFLDRYRRLSKSAQTLLLVAAADDSGRGRTIALAAQSLGAGEVAWDEVEGSGLVEVGDESLTLRHPLVRSAVYGAATSSRRRRAHRALADALAGSPDADRRAWHLAASVEAPDDEVVAALDDAADRAARRGGHEAAAAAWTRAAELTLDADARAVRLFSAAGSSLAAARPDETERLTRAALLDATDPLLRVDLLQLQGQVEWNTRSLDEGCATVCRAAAAAAPHDPTRARVLAMLAAALVSFGARLPDDVPAPETITAPPGPDAPASDRVAQHLLDGFVAAHRGAWAAAADAMTNAWNVQLGPDAPPLLRPNLAIAAMHLGDDERAVRMHDLQLRTARDAGAVNMIEHALTRGVVFRIGTGAWTEAVAQAREALLLDQNLGLDPLTAFPTAELAVLAALRGDATTAPALRDLDAVLEHHPPRGVVTGLVRDLAAWARALQPGVPPATAVQHLEQLHLPVIRWLSALDRVELAIAAYRSDLARAWLDELRGFAQGTGLTWARAAVHHGEAVLGNGDVEASFRAALDWHARSPRLPARARTQLALGEHLRRHRRRADARAPLREALTTFETLGAASWADRARQELRASGESVRRGEDRVSTELTAQESQVAGLVRQGLSNKDVAGRLFISPRTVDFHLRNVYTKLGVTSRTELAALPPGQL
ncbi:helix-turn-helix transcriptional regulator [uncultured Nocardioides sp.]|uniref:helix-turn-helix transcriptional regulator n=1 Tax=uncultured Nocardioides sp. TaxID=198441 RepID=UPI002616C522|nr:helix-turn-helix transcriptional regulator [uncultured Nocardioides sp.]